MVVLQRHFIYTFLSCHKVVTSQSVTAQVGSYDTMRNNYDNANLYVTVHALENWRICLYRKTTKLKINGKCTKMRKSESQQRMNFNTLFKTPTRTRPYSIVSSALAVCTQWRQDETVAPSIDPVSSFQVFSNPQYIWDWTVANWKLDRDKTKLFRLSP